MNIEIDDETIEQLKEIVKESSPLDQIQPMNISIERSGYTDVHQYIESMIVKAPPENKIMYGLFYGGEFEGDELVGDWRMVCFTGNGPKALANAKLLTCAISLVQMLLLNAEQIETLYNARTESPFQEGIENEK